MFHDHKTSKGREKARPVKHYQQREGYQVCLLLRKLQTFIDIEKQHIISISDYHEDDLGLFQAKTWVEWCPKFQVGTARGGTAVHHHICRHCRKICLHLLERKDGVPSRICLGCWDKCRDPRNLPDWYYHYPMNCNVCNKRK